MSKRGSLIRSIGAGTVNPFNTSNCPAKAPFQDKALNCGENSGNKCLTERTGKIVPKKREDTTEWQEKSRPRTSQKA